MRQLDCNQLIPKLYKLDRHWDEFVRFARNDIQNLDEFQFTKNGKPMTGYFKSHDVLAHHLILGRWFETVSLT